jgi:hypothetical protein
MDIYQLGIALDTSDLKQGETALDSAAGAANRAADAMDKASSSGKGWRDSIVGIASDTSTLVQQAKAMNDTQTQMALALGQLNSSFGTLGDQILGIVNGFAQMSQAQRDAGQATQALSSAQNDAAASAANLAETEEQATARIKEMVARSIEAQAALSASSGAASSAAASTISFGEATQQAAAATRWDRRSSPASILAWAKRLRRRQRRPMRPQRNSSHHFSANTSCLV